MRTSLWTAAACALFGAVVAAQGGGTQAPALPTADDPIKIMVDRLDLERYKATIKNLTQFGDRLEGTDRNKAAVDWIEQQLKSYGCSNVERMTYNFAPRQAAGGRGAPPPAAAGPATNRPVPPFAEGGGRRRGIRGNIVTPNLDPNAQPDEKLRALNAQPSAGAGPREQVYCTKVGTTRPDEMYILGGHMDGRGFGEAANDDGSGTALVMEMARVFSSPDVQTERSIRFILWNNEETGLNGARAYVEQRRDLQGKENPAGSGRYPEPKWLGMIQHDMMLIDHGMPRPDGTVSPEQRLEADVNIEFQRNSAFATQSQALAWILEQANERYATDYPALVGPHMTNTDSTPFQDVVAAISMRENDSGVQINNGWDPTHHRPTDLYANLSDKDFRLGLNAGQTTLAAVAQLTGAKMK